MSSGTASIAPMVVLMGNRPKPKAKAKNNENQSMCRECGGKCCKQMPGVTFPDDWGSTEEEMLAKLVPELAGGRYSVDCWEGDPRYGAPEGQSADTAYYVRPATINSKGIVDFSWGGQCVMLGPDGCTLAFEQRPTQCRMLEPNFKDGDNDCSHAPIWDKRHAAIAWLPYNEMLRKAIELAKVRS